MSEKNRTPVILDTSILIGCLDSLKENIENYEYVVLDCVLDELDSLNKIENKTVSKKARRAIKFIFENILSFKIKDSNLKIEKVDDKVIDYAHITESFLATNDKVMMIKACNKGVYLKDFPLDSEEKEEYSGYCEVEMTDDELSDFYSNKEFFAPLVLENQYLIIKNSSGVVVDKFKNSKGKLVSVGNKKLNSKTIGECKPLDTYQSLFVDSLLHNDMTLVKGKAGTGKTLISLTYAMNMIESGKYDKLIVASNIVNVANSGKIGYLPGTKEEKILGSFVGGMLASKLGGIEGVTQLIDKGLLVLLPISDIRGFDTTGMRAIVYIVEAQNLTVDLMKLAIQRVGDDCKLIIDGDYKQQVDMQVYEGCNNGMRRVSEVFRGKNFYGEVELRNIYRSRYADVADKM